MDKSKILIGWSRGDITPLRKTFVMGQFHARISDEIISPLTATALAFESQNANGENEQAIFLSCDLGLISIKGFKDELHKELEGVCHGFDPSKLTINATHTHTAPAVVEGWYEEPENDPDFMKPNEYRIGKLFLKTFYIKSMSQVSIYHRE